MENKRQVIVLVKGLLLKQVFQKYFSQQACGLRAGLGRGFYVV